jgi:predicted Zn-dependent protease
MIKTEKKIIIFLCLIYIFSFCFPSNLLSLTIGEEKKLAKDYMGKIKKSGLIVKDPIISSLVKNVGKEIAGVLPPQPFKFSYYVFNADSFNAFATPGANIFINQGLIAGLDNVDELAGIIAHETAHAASRHVAQLIDKSKIVNLASLAGVLAGILIGSKGNSELSQGLSMGSLAAGQSAMLTYSRAHETEADQKGFNYLTKTSFAPEGLLNGLKKIKAADFYGTEDIPDYFKTHPGTTKRIKALENMLARYGQRKKSNKIKKTKKDYNFNFIKYRIIGLYQINIKAEKIFKKLLKNNPENPACNYGYGLLLTRQLKLDKAKKYFKKALSARPFSPLILLELSNIYLQNENFSKARDILIDIKDDPVVSMPAAYLLGQVQIALNKPVKAKANFEKIINQPLIPYPKAYYYIAKIYSQNHDLGLTHYYLGYYYFNIKNKKNAIMHFEKALESLINKKKIEKINSILKELKKH